MDYVKEQVGEQVTALKGLWSNKRQVGTVPNRVLIDGLRCVACVGVHAGVLDAKSPTPAPAIHGNCSFPFKY